MTVNHRELLYKILLTIVSAIGLSDCLDEISMAATKYDIELSDEEWSEIHSIASKADDVLCQKGKQQQ